MLKDAPECMPPFHASWHASPLTRADTDAQSEPLTCTPTRMPARTFPTRSSILFGCPPAHCDVAYYTCYAISLGNRGRHSPAVESRQTTLPFV